MVVTAAIAAGPAMGMTELQHALASARVVFGTDPVQLTALAQSLADPAYVATQLDIARGLPAVPGKPGYFEPAFHVGIQPGHVDDDGTINFFDRELLKTFARDEYVGQLHQPVPGTPGRRVDGSDIAVSAVQPARLRIGPGLRTAADGRTYAIQAGVAMYSPEKTLDIVQHHIHQGHVDMHSGNLDMEGTLVVRGSIQRLFQARASGDLEIQGGIDSGSAYAGGSVRIRDGVRGGDSGMVCAEGDVSVRYAEAAHVVCGGLLKIDSAVNSELLAAKIQITRSVRGGSTQAESEVIVQEAGSARGTGTLIAAAMPLARPLLDVRRVLDTAKEERLMQPAPRMRRGESERAKGGKGGRAQLEREREDLAHKVALAERRQELMQTAFIHVLGPARAGVTIQIGTQTMNLNEDVRNARFSFDPETRCVRMERTAR